MKMVLKALIALSISITMTAQAEDFFMDGYTRYDGKYIPPHWVHNDVQANIQRTINGGSVPQTQVIVVPDTPPATQYEYKRPAPTQYKPYQVPNQFMDAN